MIQQKIISVDEQHMARSRSWTLEELADILAVAERDLKACAARHGIVPDGEGRYDLTARRQFELLALFASSPYLTPLLGDYFIAMSRRDEDSIELLPREAMALLLQAIDRVREIRRRRHEDENGPTRPSWWERLRERFTALPPLDRH